MVYNTKIIDYGDFLHVEHFDHYISRVDMPEELQKEVDKLQQENIISDIESLPDDKKIEHCLNVSVNRSKNNLYRIARSNTWDLFITLTFDRTIVDSSDYNECSKKVSKWLNNIKSRYCPDLKYLIVPELHSDKIHYHFHGLLSNCDNLSLKDSDRVDSLGAKIYNLSGWSFGFSTASKIKDQSAVRNYIGKYITKDLMNNLKYKKRYYCSKNVNICPETTHNFTLDDLYSMYGENISFLKTVTINGVNRIQYMEIKKDVDK